MSRDHTPESDSMSTMNTPPKGYSNRKVIKNNKAGKKKVTKNKSGGSKITNDKSGGSKIKLLDCESISVIKTVLSHRQGCSDVGIAQLLPKMDKTFKSFKNNAKDDPVLARVENNTAIEICKGEIVAAISDYCYKLPGEMRALGEKSSIMKTAVSLWSQSPDVWEMMPDHWGLKDDPELCFNRIPYSPMSCSWDELKDLSPIFADTIDRIKYDADLLLKWIGSVLVKGSNRRQVVWLEGPPRAGKTLLARMIASLLGDKLVTSMDSEFFNSPYLMASIDKRRLIVVNDATTSFLNTSIFKTITGGGEQLVNQKFKPAYSTKIDAKFIFTSNSRLELRRDEAAMDRVLRFTIEGRSGEIICEDEILDDMAANKDLLAGYCIDLYNGSNIGGAPLAPTITSRNAVELAVESGECEFEDLLEESFDIGPEEKIYGRDFTHVLVSSGLSTASKRKEFFDFACKRYPYICRKAGRIPGFKKVVKLINGLGLIT